MNKFSKNPIESSFKTKLTSKGFNIKPNKNEMAKGSMTMEDLVSVIAETLEELFAQNSNGEISGSLKLGGGAIKSPLAYKGAEVKFDITTDPKFFSWIETLHSLLQAVYPEPGWGAPNVFATTLKSLIPLKPTSLTGRINQGSSNIKVAQ